MTPHFPGFALTAHPTSGAGPAASIVGEITRTSSHLGVRYLLQGDLSRIVVPPPAEPGPADELWRHTCFELFLAAPGEPGYFEFNFSPSGRWAVYRFRDYRARIPFHVDEAPRITAARNDSGGLALEATVPWAGLPYACAGRLNLALSAVIEATDGTLTYWALNHPGPKPDFHHPDAFVLELR
jgi:hypothetical protein